MPSGSIKNHMSLLLTATATLALFLVSACGGSSTAPPPSSADLGAPLGVSRPRRLRLEGGYALRRLQGPRHPGGEAGAKGLGLSWACGA